MKKSFLILAIATTSFAAHANINKFTCINENNSTMEFTIDTSGSQLKVTDVIVTPNSGDAQDLTRKIADLRQSRSGESFTIKDFPKNGKETTINVSMGRASYDIRSTGSMSFDEYQFKSCKTTALKDKSAPAPTPGGF